MSYNRHTDLYEGFIYCIENLINNQKYIGQTRKSISKRWVEHKWDSIHRPDTGMVLYRAFSKYGISNFRIFQIEKVSCITIDLLKAKLNELEILYINEYASLAPSGYNVTAGGYTVSIDTQIPVYCFSLNGEMLNFYLSLSDAERDVGVSHSSISQAINPACTDKHSAGGYLWSLDSIAPTYHPDKGSGRRRRVVQMTKDGLMVNVWNSALEAASSLGLQNTLISACCNGRRKSTGGFRWAFII